jgi:8-oxo-dGTP pyrophosphatase MutT (NUDIX family)
VPDQPDTQVATVSDRVARIRWSVELTERGWQAAVDVVRRDVAAALVDHDRVEALVPVGDDQSHRIATWSGLRREGVQRRADGDVVVYARLVGDVPVHEPGGFRALLNSFLPRKRAISQMLIRDDSPEPRVLMCQLTYKNDWDLPGGVVEVGESPQLAVAREVEEELGLHACGGRRAGSRLQRPPDPVRAREPWRRTGLHRVGTLTRYRPSSSAVQTFSPRAWLPSPRVT